MEPTDFRYDDSSIRGRGYKSGSNIVRYEVLGSPRQQFEQALNRGWYRFNRAAKQYYNHTPSK